MQPRVVITRRIQPEIVEMLSHTFVIVPNMTATSLSRDELLRRSKDAQALVVTANDVVDRDFLDQCPDLRIIASTFNGPGLVDVQACSDHGVWYTVVEGLPPESIAQLEAAANVFEAFLGKNPKGADNLLQIRQRTTQKSR
jgi:phosphonate dehydrogenase